VIAKDKMLQQRVKWRTPQPGLNINDVVLVKDVNLPPLKWPLARKIELIPGADKVFRVAILKTATGTIKRAIRKLCVLPKQDAAFQRGRMLGYAA
ncbi:hypothetical protein KR222_007128, partial [Zaprionus bogoriensis]